MLGPRRSCRQTNVSGRDSTGLADIEPRRSGNGAVVLCLFYLRVAICLHECSSSLPPSFSSDLLFDIISSLSPPPPSLFDCRWSVPCPSFTFTWIPVNFILKVNRTSRRSLYSVDSSLSLSSRLPSLVNCNWLGWIECWKKRSHWLLAYRPQTTTNNYCYVRTRRSPEPHPRLIEYHWQRSFLIGRLCFRSSEGRCPLPITNRSFTFSLLYLFIYFIFFLNNIWLNFSLPNNYVARSKRISTLL